MAYRVARALAACVLCTCAGCSTGDTSSAETTAARASASPADLAGEAEQIQKYVAQVWPRTGRIWPGMDFSRHVLLLTDGKEAWAIDKASRQKVTLESLKDNKTSLPSPGGFAMTNWKGRNAVIIRLRTPEAAAKLREETTGLTSPDVPAFDFEFATHEQFHTYVQLGDRPWTSLGKLSQGDGDGRDELYPLQAAPRLQRAMIYNSLLAAYQQPKKQTEHLAAAAHWQEKWASEYPQEKKTQEQTDLLEGTTQYVETMAGAMALVEDSENTGQVRDFLTRTLKPMKVASKSEETYAIGAAALLNADAMGKPQMKQALTTEAATPASWLLKDVDPSPQPAPKDFKKSIERSITQQNRQLATTIEPFVQAMQDKKSWILMLPDEALQGSMDASFYTTKKLPISIKNNAYATFRLHSGEVVLDKTTTGELKRDGKTYYAIPLNPADKNISLDGEKLTLKDPRLAGNVTVKVKTDDGQRMLYAQ